MMHVNNLFRELFHNCLQYRYSYDQWAKVNQFPGHPYPSIVEKFEDDEGEGMAELIQPPLQPTYITQQEYDQLEGIASGITSLFEKTLEFVREIKRQDEAIPQELQGVISQLEWENLEHNPGYDCVLPIVRLDCIRTSSGFQILDINTTRPAGIGDNIILKEAFAPNEVTFDMHTAFRKTVLECFSQWVKQKANPEFLLGHRIPLRILVPDVFGDYMNFVVLSHSLWFWGSPVISVDEWTGGEFDEHHQCIIRGRIKEGLPGYKNLAEPYPDEFCILSPLHRRFLGSKVWTYLIRKGLLWTVWDHNERDFLNCFPGIGLLQNEEIDFGEQVVPLQSVDHRQWLAKPINGSSGKGIIFGCQMGKAKWLRRLSEIPGKVIVQQYLPSREKFMVAGSDGEPMERELYTKYGVFILNGKLAGIEVMARPSPLVHGARDTYIGTCVKSCEEGLQ